MRLTKANTAAAVPGRSGQHTLEGGTVFRQPASPRLSFLLPLVLNPRFRSLARANVLVLGSLVLAVPLSHFPHLRPSLLVALPALGAVVGTADTTRCLRPRWSFYHAGVILCLYMDLMAISLVLFLLLYPYFA